MPCGTLDDVVTARNVAMSAQGPAQVGAAKNAPGLIALSEAYPDLKANANFQQLAGKLPRATSAVMEMCADKPRHGSPIRSPLIRRSRRGCARR
ncbi:MAG: hypothetical protein NTAFB05_02960 [Nitrobacter sp.]